MLLSLNSSLLGFWVYFLVQQSLKLRSHTCGKDGLFSKHWAPVLCFLGISGARPRPDSTRPHDSSLVRRLKKIDNCEFQKQNKQTKKAFVALLSCGGTWMIKETKIIAYFALPQKPAFCQRSSLLESHKQASLWKISDPLQQDSCSPPLPKVTAKSFFPPYQGNTSITLPPFLKHFSGKCKE